MKKKQRKGQSINKIQQNLRAQLLPTDYPSFTVHGNKAPHDNIHPPPQVTDYGIIVAVINVKGWPNVKLYFYRTNQ